MYALCNKNKRELSVLDSSSGHSRWKKEKEKEWCDRVGETDCGRPETKEQDGSEKFNSCVEGDQVFYYCNI